MKFKDAALVAAAVLSHRYITDRFLPDKAIDLVDEAASKLRMEIDSMPAELDEVRRRIMQLEIEREALRKETDKASEERLGKLEKELADLKEEQTRLQAHWEQEKDAIQARAQAEGAARSRRASRSRRAQRAGDYAKASELQYGRIPELERKIREAEAPARRAAEDAADAEGRSRRGRHRRSRRQVDQHPGEPADGRRNPEADSHGRAPPRARRRPGRGDHRRGERDAPRPRRPAGSESAARQLHLPRARPASARPSWRARSPSSCSTTSRR